MSGHWPGCVPNDPEYVCIYNLEIHFVIRLLDYVNVCVFVCVQNKIVVPGFGDSTEYRFSFSDYHCGLICAAGKEVVRIYYKIDTFFKKRPYIPKEKLRTYESKEEEASKTGHGGQALLNSQLQMNLCINDESKTKSWKKIGDKIVSTIVAKDKNRPSRMNCTIDTLGYFVVGMYWIAGKYDKLSKLYLEFLPHDKEYFKLHLKFPSNFSQELADKICTGAADGDRSIFYYVQEYRKFVYNSYLQVPYVDHSNFASFVTVDGMPIYTDCVKLELAEEIGYCDGKKYVSYNLFVC